MRRDHARWDAGSQNHAPEYAGSQNAQIHPNTAPPDFQGTTVISFQLTDPAGLTASRSATLLVSAVNDPPTLLDVFTTGLSMTEDQAFSVTLDSLVSDSDSEASALTWSVTPGKSVAAQVDTLARRLLLSAPPNFNGPDTLQVTISDGSGGQVQGFLPIRVQSTNDLPVFTATLPLIRAVAGDTLIDFSPYVADGDDEVSTLIWSIAGAGDVLSASMGNDGKLSLSIPGNWSDTLVLSIRVEDPQGGSRTGSITIIRQAPGDFRGNGTLDFPDFILFAQHYGTREGNSDYDPAYDLNGNGSVDFPDFVQFAILFDAG